MLYLVLRVSLIMNLETVSIMLPFCCLSWAEHQDCKQAPPCWVPSTCSLSMHSWHNVTGLRYSSKYFHIPFNESLSVTKIQCSWLHTWKNSIILTYSSHIYKCFPHHISVELLLVWIQQSPLLHGEGHSNILKGHCLLNHHIYMYRKMTETHSMEHFNSTHKNLQMRLNPPTVYA